MLRFEVFTQTPLWHWQEVKSLLPQVDPSGFDAGPSYPFCHSACHLPEGIFKGKQGDFRETWEGHPGEGGLKLLSRPSPCSMEITEDYSVRTNGDYLFRACYIWVVSTITVLGSGSKAGKGVGKFYSEREESFMYALVGGCWLWLEVGLVEVEYLLWLVEKANLAFFGGLWVGRRAKIGQLTVVQIPPALGWLL